MKLSFLRSTMAPALALLAAGFFSVAKADVMDISGGLTTVNLDSATVTALTNLGIKLAPLGTATLSGLTATFPITGGTIDSSTEQAMVEHNGIGLWMSNGTTQVELQNFLINVNLGTEMGVLSGEVTIGSVSLEGVPLFNIGSGLALTLTSQAGGALSQYLGIPNLTGASIGTASVSPTISPEPESAGLAATALLLMGAGAWWRKPARGQSAA